jgi:hypothetical protein
MLLMKPRMQGGELCRDGSISCWAILREEESVAGQVLLSKGVRLDDLREQVISAPGR